ncbi:MAG: aldo/keto reductase [Microscillaceae bacterium]|jgi:aryl-alcohol dehydrogenase-like predicted oxidoreductase|nr:aldo/keto reductase [Microscillaceae bacterium]
MKYNNLGNTGLLVSELCLGAMTFGGKGFWSIVGKQQLDEVNNLIKTAFEAGINFYDTANAYSEGQSEELLGQSIKVLGLSRQDLVIATKVRLRMGQGVNQVGLSRAHIYDSVDASLQRLQTSHLDLLYVHGVDFMTALDETMRGLEDVVRAGKVRYLGVCNFPAWQVMKANAIAEKYNWTKFSALQYFYSIAERAAENDIVPLAIDQQMSLMPWSPLAGGFLSGKFSRDNQSSGENARRDQFDFPLINKEKAFDIIELMQKIAQTKQVSVAQIALAWLLKKTAVGSVIIGAKKQDQLLDNIASTQIQFSADEMNELDEISTVMKPYPNWMVDWQMRDRLIS